MHIPKHRCRNHPYDSYYLPPSTPTAAPATADYSYPYRDYSYPYRLSNPRLRQLPPILAANALPHPSGIDLSMTFFDRLVHLGHCTKKLRTQYRCHPNISSLVRHTIYHGELVDGVDSADRPPLAPLLPPFVLCDVRSGVEQPSPGGSFFNRAEASVVAHTVLALLALGLEPSQLGVICLYKAQVLSRAGDFRSGGSGLGRRRVAACVFRWAQSAPCCRREAVRVCLSSARSTLSRQSHSPGTAQASIEIFDALSSRRIARRSRTSTGFPFRAPSAMSSSSPRAAASGLAL